uniref:Uncharacterized protein n=1 Tax=Oryza glumipatula TaxID=40148 RepID=A0A0E0AFP0_9ORYZ
MAMRALLPKLRIPAAASRRTLPPFRSSSTASQDKLAAAKERSPQLYDDYGADSCSILTSISSY